MLTRKLSSLLDASCRLSRPCLRLFLLAFMVTALLCGCTGPELAHRPPQLSAGMERGPVAGRAGRLALEPTDHKKGEIVSGRIMVDGSTPMSGGRVAFFAKKIGPPSNDANLRRIPERMAVIGPDGTFSHRLPAGRYYLGAMSRDLSLGPGPPRAGEKTYIATDNLGRPRIIEIGQKGGLQLDAVTVRAREQFPIAENACTLSGTVRDAAGRPVAGAVLLIRTSPKGKRPNFIWEKTAADGRFSFRLPAGRPYYLLAKDLVGSGRPEPGQRVGAYTGGSTNVVPQPVPVSGKAGETLSSLDITLNELPDPKAQKAKYQGRLPPQ